MRVAAVPLEVPSPHPAPCNPPLLPLAAVGFCLSSQRLPATSSVLRHRGAPRPGNRVSLFSPWMRPNEEFYQLPQAAAVLSFQAFPAPCHARGQLPPRLETQLRPVHVAHVLWPSQACRRNQLSKQLQVPRCRVLGQLPSSRGTRWVTVRALNESKCVSIAVPLPFRKTRKKGVHSRGREGHLSAAP